MAMNELEFQMYDPTLTLNWQWEKAQKLFDRKQGRKKVKDHQLPLINEAVKYLGDPTNKAYEDIKRAHEMFSDRTVTRCELNARILAGQTNDEVAEHVPALTSEQIEIYESLFFYVRARSEMTPWILKRTVKNRQLTGFDQKDLGEFWCFIATSGGLKFLEHFIQLYRTIVQDNDVVDLTRYFGFDKLVPINTQAFVANNMLSPVPRTAKAIQEIRLAVFAAEAITDPEQRRKAIDQCQRYTVIAARAYLAKQKIPTWRQFSRPSPKKTKEFKAPSKAHKPKKRKGVRRSKPCT